MNKKLIVLISVGCFLLAPVASVFSFDSLYNSSAVQDKAKNDSDVTKSVKDAVAADSDLSGFANTVIITTENGIVTITGFVDNQDAKAKVEAKVKAVSGVNQVKNNLEVKSDASVK